MLLPCSAMESTTGSTCGASLVPLMAMEMVLVAVLPRESVAVKVKDSVSFSPTPSATTADRPVFN